MVAFAIGVPCNISGTQPLHTNNVSRATQRLKISLLRLGKEELTSTFQNAIPAMRATFSVAP